MSKCVEWIAMIKTYNLSEWTYQEEKKGFLILHLVSTQPVQMDGFYIKHWLEMLLLLRVLQVYHAKLLQNIWKSTNKKCLFRSPSSSKLWQISERVEKLKNMFLKTDSKDKPCLALQPHKNLLQKTQYWSPCSVLIWIPS